MGRFQDLRDEGGFAQTPQPANSCAVAHKRERIDSPLAFCSDIISNRCPNIKYGVNSLKAKEKTFSNRYKVRLFPSGSAGSEQLVFAGVVWLRDDFLEAQAEFFEQGDGDLIGGLGVGDDAFEPQNRP